MLVVMVTYALALTFSVFGPVVKYEQSVITRNVVRDSIVNNFNNTVVRVVNHTTIVKSEVPVRQVGDCIILNGNANKVWCE